ncbi:MAG: hypothetical protein FJW79_04245 [Actinobacteria bacterium]|nr:hypothetical protein [Actinomycetota bacterium]
MYRSLTILMATAVSLIAACGGGAGGPATTGGQGTTTSAVATTTTNSSGGTTACTDLVTLDEAAALFGEPAEFDAESSSASTCSWTTVEDPEDFEDLEVQLLLVQVYRGAEYYAPEMIYPEAEPLSGIGQKAYVDVGGSVSAGALDGDWAIFVDYSILFGDTPAAAKKDQVIALLRLVHDRVV